jgi:uncharacterized protein YlxP (DUF503 family)
MPVGLLLLYLHLPDCNSLKEKRSAIKPILARLHRDYNVSAAELARQDAWRYAELGCAIVSNETAHIQTVLQQVTRSIETNWPNVELVDQHINIY